MSNELNIVSDEVLDYKDKNDLDLVLDRLINQHKQNRQDINKLVFESVESLTEADMIQRNLSEKSFFRRLIGNLTGSNQKLQDRINNNKSIAQYAFQQVLRKLSEQNLMSLELITRVINRLNFSIYRTEDKFNSIYAELHYFFQHNRDKLTRIENRLEKIERNVDLLNWQSTIRDEVFENIEYAQLDVTSKIVCLVRDFYDYTKGNWETNELKQLKAAMRQLNISPKQYVNYFKVIRNISNREELISKLLSGRSIGKIDRLDIITSFGLLKMIDEFKRSDSYGYMTDTLEQCLSEYGIHDNKDIVIDNLVKTYFKKQLKVNTDTEVEAYDLILDLLYDLKDAEELNILIEDNIPGIALNKASELQGAIDLFMNNKKSEAFDIFVRLADNGDGRAAYFVGLYYLEGYNVVQCSDEKKLHYLRMGTANSDILSSICILKEQNQDNPENVIYQFFENQLKKLSVMNDCFAKHLFSERLSCNSSDEDSFKIAISLAEECVEQGVSEAFLTLGKAFNDGRGVEQDLEKAVDCYKKAAEEEACLAQRYLGNIYSDEAFKHYNLEVAAEWYEKASEQGDYVSQYELGMIYSDENYKYHNLKEACKWYRKSARIGYYKAQKKLGDCYYYGWGLRQDYSKAVKWYKFAAEQGDAYSQYSLGYMYYYGKGISENIQEGAKWFRSAAEQGYQDAIEECDRLGIAYK